MNATATAPAKAKKTAKPAVELQTVLAPGTEVRFKGYAEKVDKPVLVAGKTYFVLEYFPDDKIYNVGNKLNAKKALDSVTREEVDVFSTANVATGEILTNVEADDETAATPKGKKAKAAKAKAAKPTKEEKLAARAAAKEAKDSERAAAKAAKNAEREAKRAAKLAKRAPEEDYSDVKVQKPIADLIKEAGGDPLAAAEKLVNVAQRSMFELGGVLMVAKVKASHRNILEDGQPVYEEGGRGFDQWCERHIGLKARKAAYAIKLYATFTRAGVTESQIDKIGWSKLIQAAGVIDENNAQEVIADCKRLPISELNASIKKRMLAEGKQTDARGGNRTDMTSYKFRVFNDQAAVLAAALDTAAVALGIDKPSENPDTFAQALMHIVSEWSSLQQPEQAAA
jgi:hypothetical protein